MNNETANPPKTFLDLPIKIRNKIYELASFYALKRCRVCRSFMRGDQGDLHLSSTDCLYKCGTSQLSPIRQANTNIMQSEQHSLWTYDDSKVCLFDEPALTRVSKQIRYETLPMFYGLNTFIFAGMEQQHWKAVQKACDEEIAWLKQLGKDKPSMIRDLRIGFGRSEADTDIFLVETTTKLELLGVRRGTYRYGKFDRAQPVDSDYAKQLARMYARA